MQNAIFLGKEETTVKKKYDEGFTLVELLVSIVILAAIVLPTCSSLVLSYRMNAKTNQMMQAQLAVSSAVEKLMAEGITNDFVEAVSKSATESGKIETADNNKEITGNCEEFPGLQFTLSDRGDYYDVIVQDENGMVSVVTSIRDCTTEKEVADHEKT